MGLTGQIAPAAAKGLELLVALLQVGCLTLLLLWLVGLVCLATAQLVGAVLGGGDWMELGRVLMAPMALLWLGLCADLGPGRLAWPAISEVQAARFRLTTLAPFPACGAPLPAAAVWVHGESRPQRVPLPLASPGGGPGQGLCRWPWEALKAPNLSDCHFLAAVARAEGEQGRFSIRPGDILLSYQAGMVPYHLLARDPQLRFIDSVGLASPERTSVPRLALRGQGPGSPQVMLRFVQTYRLAFVVDLGESRRLLADQGYLPVVSVALRVRGIPYEEVLHLRADRLRPGW